jgi:rhamnosyltransferase
LTNTEKILKPKVAILMATFNGCLWIEDQIKSILSQQDVEVTLFISDDYSDDGTYRYLKAQCLNCPQIHLLSRSQRFGNAAQNFFHLIQFVNFKAFDYVSLSDQDDIWATDKLSRAVHQMQIQNATCYSSDVLAFWENGKTALIKKSQDQVSFDYLLESSGPGCTFVMKKDSALFLKKHL